MNKLEIKADRNKLQKLLGKNLYSDKFSFITEVVSNAKDSMTRAGNKGFINVSIIREDDGYWWVVKDEGVGLNKEELIDRVFTLLNSDKEEEETTIGNKGVGKIAFSAYNKECFYTCIKDGVGVKSSMYETEYDGICYSDLEEFDAEDEKNGVEFRIKINTNVNDFIGKMYEKLAYFGDIHYNILGGVNDNSFKIYRNDEYQVSDLCRDEFMHLTIDDVYYPINWNKIGISPIKVPIGIRFHLKDGIEVSTTRESVIYDDAFKELLNQRIEEALAKISGKFEKELKISKDLCYFYNKKHKNIALMFGNKVIHLNNLLYTGNIPAPHIKGVGIKAIETFLSNIWYSYTSLGRMSSWGKYSSNSHCYTGNFFEKETVIVECEEAPRRKRCDYYKWKYPNKNIYFIRRNKVSLKRLKLFSEYKWENIKAIYKSTGVNILRNFVNDWYILEKELFSSFIRDNEVEYDKAFLDGRKGVRESKKIEKKEGEIVIKLARDFQVNTGSNNPCKYENKQLNLATAYKEKLLTIYGKNIHLDKLNNVVRMFQDNQRWYKTISRNIRIMIVGDRDYKKLENIHNFMDVETFIKGENKTFRRIVTKYVIAQLVVKYPIVFKRRDLIKEHLSTKYGEELDRIFEYQKDTVGWGPLMDAAVELVKANGYWDWSIWPTFLSVQKEVEKLEWIKYLEPKLNEQNPTQEGLVQCMKDLCKYYKFKLNWNNYGHTTESNN